MVWGDEEIYIPVRCGLAPELYTLIFSLLDALGK